MGIDIINANTPKITPIIAKITAKGIPTIVQAQQKAIKKQHNEPKNNISHISS